MFAQRRLVATRERITPADGEGPTISHLLVRQLPADQDLLLWTVDARLRAEIGDPEAYCGVRAGRSQLVALLFRQYNWHSSSVLQKDLRICACCDWRSYGAGSSSIF